MKIILLVKINLIKYILYILKYDSYRMSVRIFIGVAPVMNLVNKVQLY